MFDGFGLSYPGGDIIFPPDHPVEGSFYAGQGQVVDEKLMAVMEACGLVSSFNFSVGSDRQYIDGTEEWLTIIDPRKAAIRVLLSVNAKATAIEMSRLEGEARDVITGLILRNPQVAVGCGPHLPTRPILTAFYQ